MLFASLLLLQELYVFHPLTPPTEIEVKEKQETNKKQPCGPLHIENSCSVADKYYIKVVCVWQQKPCRHGKPCNSCIVAQLASG